MVLSSVNLSLFDPNKRVLEIRGATVAQSMKVSESNIRSNVTLSNHVHCMFPWIDFGKDASSEGNTGKLQYRQTNMLI